MADGSDHIDKYFSKSLSADENRRFDQRIIDDPAFAEEVAFYAAALEVARQQVIADKKERFRQLYDKGRSEIPSYGQIVSFGRTQKLLPYLAAAILVLLVMTLWLLFLRPRSPQQLAEKYTDTHWQDLPVTMTDKASPVLTGLQLYNDRHFLPALEQFKKAMLADSTDTKAVEYAGITAFRLQNYELAIALFVQLEKRKGLFANPGMFDHALTLLERNHVGDAATAKGLLEQVVREDLTGKQAAQDLLKKW
jgi:hypothetical protein